MERQTNPLPAAAVMALCLSLGACQQPAERTPVDRRATADATSQGSVTTPAAGAEESIIRAWAPGQPYTAGDYIYTGDAAWDLYNGAQQHWQKTVQDLVSRRRPDLAEVSTATLNMHWSLLDLRSARIRYLLEHDPIRFVRDQDLAQFIHFAWTPEDDAVVRADPVYAALEAQVEGMRQQAEQHADYAASREFLLELAVDAEFRQTVAEFAEAGKAVEALLSSE